MINVSLSLTTCTRIFVLALVSLSVFLYHCLFQHVSLYHYLCQLVTITISITMPQSLYLYLISTITATVNVTMSQSLSHYLNICHTISTCTCLNYIPRNNHPLISFGSSNFTSYTFPKHWTFQEISHIPQHNHGLCQDNHCDLCQDHHRICLDNNHDLYKQITKIYATIIINCAPTSIPISP